MKTPPIIAERYNSETKYEKGASAPIMMQKIVAVLARCQASVKATKAVELMMNASPHFGSPLFHLLRHDKAGLIHCSEFGNAEKTLLE